MKKYCPNCGKANPIGSKFCCHCGNATTLASKVKKSLPGEQEDEDEDMEETFDVQASKLDIEIMDTPSYSETVGGLIQQGPVSDGLETIRGGGPTIDKDAFMKQFRKEAGPARGGQSIGEE
jgi:hypothetical protein